MTKAAWKWFYRQQRIVARESSKAVVDMMLYGAGYVKLNNETGEVSHIPWQEVQPP